MRGVDYRDSVAANWGGSTRAEQQQTDLYVLHDLLCQVLAFLVFLQPCIRVQTEPW